MKDRFFRQLCLAAVSAFMLSSCAEQAQEVVVHPIQDNAEPRVMGSNNFTASAELVASLGLEEGVPAAMCAELS